MKYFTHFKSLNKPPKSIDLVASSFCILFGKEDNWEEFTKFLTFPKKFKKDSANFHKDSLTKEMVDKLIKYTKNLGCGNWMLCFALLIFIWRK